MGNILAGPRDFISRAVRCRKALGGVLWQVGPLAAAGRLALVNMKNRLEKDHHNAKTFAQGEQLSSVQVLSHIMFALLPCFCS